jgi:hypothetical protein
MGVGRPMQVRETLLKWEIGAYHGVEGWSGAVCLVMGLSTIDSVACLCSRSDSGVRELPLPLAWLWELLE